MKIRYKTLLNSLQEEISLPKTKENYRVVETAFTRQRKLNFSTLVNLRLNLMNKSTSVELNKYFSQQKIQSVSKQAFSKAIKKIKWEGFEHFNNFFIKGFYETDDYQRFKGKYMLVATDGTTFELPYIAELVEHFGVFDNGQMSQPICMARSVKLFDVLNKKTIKTCLEPYRLSEISGTKTASLETIKNTSEQALFEACLKDTKHLINPEKHDILLVGDRLYPSFYYFKSLPEQGFNFVFRCKTNFCTELNDFAQSGQQEALLTIDLEKSLRKYVSSASKLDKQIDSIQVRCIRIDTPNKPDKAIFLLTNLTPQECTKEELGQVYKMRWAEETSFDVDKNIMEMENFSSKSVNGVLQEFYAKTLTGNIASLVIEQAQQELNEEQQQKDNKYYYKINQAIAIGLIKDEIISFLDASETASQWIERMTKLILPHRVPIRPGRSYPKKRKHKLKFSMNMRRTT